MRFIDDDLRNDLEAVIDVLLPFDAWLTTKTYTPPDPDLPWRNGSKLNAASLQIVPLIDAFIAATSDADLLHRFDEVAERPLAYSPIDDVLAWRLGRGLEAEAEFGVAESQNMLLDAMGKAATRAALYKRYLPFFRGAMKGYRNAPAPPAFADFVEALATDKSQFWPDASPSSPFIKQLLKDALFTILEMRGPLPEPWNSAIAIELGEHRRPGNQYTPDDTKQAVDAFKKAMKTIDPKAAPSTSSTPSPVGSPPLTYRSTP
jgi:hypothetical protein